MQYTLALIEHRLQNDVIQQRSKDGYINATAMCRAAGKQWNDYSRLISTREFLGELASETGIPVTELVQSLRGGDPILQGTWVHPDVAIHLAQWLSPKFAVRVSRWVREWISGASNAPVSYHIRRYTANLQKVPHGYFSMLQEMMVRLIGPMEARGYVLPENMLPDISEGKMFCKFLREELGVDTERLPTYEHEYEDGRRVRAKLYPLGLLSAFLCHFHETWLPQRAEGYFAKRDAEALEYLPYLLPRPMAAE